jgi:hypothetical protein
MFVHPLVGIAAYKGIGCVIFSAATFFSIETLFSAGSAIKGIGGF